MEITSCLPRDLEIVSPLLFRAVKGTRAAFEREEDARKTLSDALKLGHASPWCVLLGRDAGEILGVAVAGPPVSEGLAPEDSELRMLAVLPTGQGRRLGDALVVELSRALRLRATQALWAQGRLESLAPLIHGGGIVLGSLGGERVLARLHVAPEPLELETPRLRLRDWREADLEPYVRLCQDQRVLEFIPKATTEEVLAQVETFQQTLTKLGFGPWAVEEKASGAFIGMAALKPTSDLPFSPTPELAYRFAPSHWGRGLASEAASAARDLAFRLGFDEVVAFTVPKNVRSRRVMERLGLREDPAGSFHHPTLPLDHPLSLHVLYRQKRPERSLGALPPNR